MTIESQYDGKCKGFKNPDGTLTIHTWTKGQQIHYQKEPKCICTNEACFNAQKAGGGNASSTTKEEKTPVAPAVTIEHRIANLKAFMELCKSADPEVVPACASVWNNTK